MRRKKIIILFIVLLSGGITALYFSPFRTILPGVRRNDLTVQNYRLEKDTLKKQHDALAKKWSTSDQEGKRGILTEAGKLFMNGLSDRLFQYWFETDWDYNGTTEEPGTGSIACGYFVTTLLRDMGVKLDRSALAQCASEEMIKKLSEERNIHRFSNFSIVKFIEEIKKLGEGVYLTGLDNHTGFIICKDGSVDFVDSGGGVPARVQRREALTAGLLVRSRYRVVAKISGDEKFLSHWLRNEKF